MDFCIKMPGYKGLLSEQTAEDTKCHILLETIKLLRKMENNSGYDKIIQDIVPVALKNIETFEKEHKFSADELELYVQKYEDFWEEYTKYQVWLLGNEEGCHSVRMILDYNKVHLLGELVSVSGGGLNENCDYVIVCSPIDDDEIERMKDETVIRYDFLRFCTFLISPESAYYEIKLRKEIEQDIDGAVTGLSYEQRGINFDKTIKKLVCLARPSQDLYLDYHSFLWLYHEVVVKRKKEIKYCIIGMDFYRFWYDLSLSAQRTRMLCFYDRLRCVHHFHHMDVFIQKCEEGFKACGELMLDHYREIDFNNTVHPEFLYGKRVTEQYKVTEESYQKDKEEVKKVFDKPYPRTFKENVGILKKFLKFLNLHKIRALIYIPPFPKIFNEFTSVEMKQETWNVLSELKGVYGFEILNLSENELFEDRHFADWCHLNDDGADLATELLNEYMQNWK